MKKLLLTLAIVLAMAVPAVAWELRWDAATWAAGYSLEHKAVSATAWTVVDVGNVTVWTIPSTLTKGTRYEFRVHGYAGTPRSYGGYSNTIRWTYPLDPTVIELPVDDYNITIRQVP